MAVGTIVTSNEPSMLLSVTPAMMAQKSTLLAPLARSGAGFGSMALLKIGSEEGVSSCTALWGTKQKLGMGRTKTAVLKYTRSCLGWSDGQRRRNSAHFCCGANPVVPYLDSIILVADSSLKRNDLFLPLLKTILLSPRALDSCKSKTYTRPLSAKNYGHLRLPNRKRKINCIEGPWTSKLSYHTSSSSLVSCFAQGGTLIIRWRLFAQLVTTAPGHLCSIKFHPSGEIFKLPRRLTRASGFT